MKNVTATTDSGIPARSITSMQNAKETHSSLLKIGIAAVLALLLVLSGAAAADTAEAADVYDEAALREAVTQPDFNVRLCADIKLTDFYKTGRDNSLVIPPAVTKGTIDLNGHTLLYAGVYSTQSGDNNGAVIIIKSGELTVNDSSSEKTGKITGGRGTHTLMTYGQNYLFGGGVYVADGARLILNGGSISDNRIDDVRMIDAAGAGVYADGYGEVIMNGGSITNNYASAHNGYGAGVHIRRGSFTMTGGTISGNIASSSNSVGGGVYIWGSARFEMTGGVISGNSANRGGGVYVNSGATFSVKGDVSIMDNSKNDVALIDGHFRTIPKGMLNLNGELLGKMLVVLDKGYRGPVFGTVSGGASAVDARWIINEQDGKSATVVNGNLEWGDKISTNTLITLVWDDKDKFYEDKIGHVVTGQGSRWIHITPISKPGHSFTGWYLQEQGGTTPLIDVNGSLAKGMASYTNDAGEWTYTGDTLTLYAGWNHDGTLLTLNAAGGDPGTQQVTVKYDSTTVVYSKPSREDAKPYIFCGWFLEREEGKTLLIDVNGNLEKNVTVGDKRYTDAAGRWTYSEPTLTLYAGWYANGTMLTLNGYLGEPAAQTVAVELGATKVSGINLSVIDGYACTGWYKLITNVPIKFINRDGTLEKNVTDGVTQYTNENGEWIYYQTTLDLTAEWITNVTYCYSNETVVKDGKKNYYLGESFDIPNATDFGISFFGWRVGSPIGPFIFFCQGTDYQYLTPSPYYDNNYNWTAKEESLKLYAAIWGENGVSNGGNAVPTSLFTVTYDANGAESGRVPVEKEWYAPGDTVTVRGNTGALERYGYTFSGWNTQANGGGTHYNARDIFTINDNTTLYAQWTANQYTVTFETGNGSPVTITANHNATISKPNPDPTWEGYPFDGWYKITNSAEKWDFASDKVTENITLYANWVVQPYTISFDGNGGEVSQPTLETIYGQTVKLVTATRSNHIHTGWSLSKSGSAIYAANQNVTDLGNVTLYAVWKPESKAYNLTIHVINGTDSSSASNATVILKQGSAELQNKTADTNGNVTFTKVPEGIYTLAATDEGNTKGITQSVTVTKEQIVNITLPTKRVKSDVEVSTKNGTPAVVVDGLAKVADKLLNNSESVKASVEAKTEETEEIQKIKSEAAGVTQLLCLEINITKSNKTDGSSGKITNTGDVVLEFIIPYSINGKNIKLYRCHGDTVTELRQLPNKPDLKEDGTFWADIGKDLIYLYASNFSTYAIGLSDPPQQSSSSSSSRDYGASVWLQPTAEPTPMPAAAEEPTLAQPAASPVNQPQQTSTPVPIAVIIAGLGAAGLVFGLRRK